MPLIDPIVRDATADAVHPPCPPAERARARRLVALAYAAVLAAVATLFTWPWGG